MRRDADLEPDFGRRASAMADACRQRPPRPPMSRSRPAGRGRRAEVHPSAARRSAARPRDHFERRIPGGAEFDEIGDAGHGAGRLVLLAAAAAFVFLTARLPGWTRWPCCHLSTWAAIPATEYLSDGISESIINNLSQLPKLSVRSSVRSRAIRGKDVSPAAAGKELKVPAVLTGRLVKRGDEFAISAELIDVRHDRQIWGSQYTRKVADMLAIQEQISREISEKLQLRLSGEQKQRMTRHATEDTEAYQMYLQGRYYWNKRTLEGVQQSIDFFQQAIQKDPKYALAYAGQADAYALLGDLNVLPAREVTPKVKAARAARRWSLTTRLAEAHTSLAFAKFREWDWAGAEKEFKRAIELNAELSDRTRLVRRIPDGIGTLRRGAGGNESGQRAQSALARDQPGAGHPLLLRAPVSASHRAVPEDGGDGRRIPGGARIPGPRLSAEAAYPEGIAEFRKALQLSDGDTNELAALGLGLASSTRRPRRARLSIN